MNDLARPPIPVAPASLERRPSSGRAIAQLLERADDTLLVPWRMLDETFAKFPSWYRAVYDPAPSTEDLRRPGERGAAAHRVAEAILSVLPPTERLSQIVAALGQLQVAAPDDAQARLLISVMVDGFPNARPHSPEAYLEVLVHEVSAGAFPAAVVAQACRVVSRTAKFPPSVAEFLAACGKAAEVVRYLPRFTAALELRQKVESAASAAARLGPGDLEPRREA